jgi:propionyl-CoA synthetase
MTRLDEIINTAGHRLSTAGMEEELLRSPKVAEAAVVGKTDDLKG